MKMMEIIVLLKEGDGFLLILINLLLIVFIIFWRRPFTKLLFLLILEAGGTGKLRKSMKTISFTIEMKGKPKKTFDFQRKAKEKQGKVLIFKGKQRKAKEKHLFSKENKGKPM